MLIVSQGARGLYYKHPKQQHPKNNVSMKPKEVFVCIIPAVTMKLLPARKSRRASTNKSAYLIGSGLAALAAACFLVRDGQMKR